MASHTPSARDLLDRHAEALQLFTGRVHAVRDDQWSASTPCTEWSVRDLVTHLATEQLWVPSLVTEGRTVAEVGDAFDGDVLGDDPVTVWDRAAAEAREAFAAPGALERTVNLSYGDSAADAYCAQMVSDAVSSTPGTSPGRSAPTNGCRRTSSSSPGARSGRTWRACRRPACSPRPSRPGRTQTHRPSCSRCSGGRSDREAANGSNRRIGGASGRVGGIAVTSALRLACVRDSGQWSECRTREVGAQPWGDSSLR